MVLFMSLLFWFSSLLIIYIYVGYPLLLRFLPKKTLTIKTHHEDSELPAVSVLIPAFNESKHIESTILNKLSQQYPSNKIQVIVISDESEDGTDEIVQKIAVLDERVRLIRQSPRQGKTAGLNLAMPHTTGDIVIFSDANSHYADDTIAKLVQNFTDPSVGYVTGKMIYVESDGTVAGDGCSAYMRYENHIRELETQVESIVGVDGGVDAIRKELYQPMNADQLPDFVLPLKVITQGKRVIYCADALLQEETLSDSNSEFKMRVRVSLRALWAMWDMQHLFNPNKYGIFTLQLISHKLLRYLAFIPLIIAFISNGFISSHNAFYALTFWVQILFYGAAAFVALNEGTNNKILRLTHYFCLINIAAAMAFIRFIKGEKIVLWKPRVG